MSKGVSIFFIFFVEAIYIFINFANDYFPAKGKSHIVFIND